MMKSIPTVPRIPKKSTTKNHKIIPQRCTKVLKIHSKATSHQSKEETMTVLLLKTPTVRRNKVREMRLRRVSVS
jgi:hypothetical protein